MTPQERGDLAERLLPIAAKLACIAHGDGDHHDITHHTRKLNRDELIALAVILASMVNPDQTIDDALGHVTWDEHGRPAPATAYGPLTIRQTASHIRGPECLGAARILESERIQLARELHLGQGYTITEVGVRVGASHRTMQSWAEEWAA
jgi:hypothetical protein